MEWFKNHGDAIAIITVSITCFWTLNEKISVLERDVSNIRTEVAIIKTVMIMKNIMPSEVVHSNQDD